MESLPEILRSALAMILVWGRCESGWVLLWATDLAHSNIPTLVVGKSIEVSFPTLLQGEIPIHHLLEDARCDALNGFSVDTCVEQLKVGGPPDVWRVQMKPGGTDTVVMTVEPTQIKESAAVIKFAQDAMREAYAEIDTLSSFISHEVLAPIRGAKQASQALSRRFGDPKELHLLHDRLGLIEQQVRMLRELSRSFSRGNLGSQVEQLNVYDMVYAAAEEARAQGYLETSLLSVEGDDRIQISAPRPLLLSAFLNIISNSSKYRSTDRRHRLRVIIERSNGVVRINFQDNGEGIEEGEEEIIFRMFSRSRRARQREKKGEGIGLALVRRTIHLMKGQIEARRRDHGLEIVVTLPYVEQAITPRRAAHPRQDAPQLSGVWG